MSLVQRVQAAARALTARGEPAHVHEGTGWEDTARQYARNADYYRGLLEQIGARLGEAAYIADDGGRADAVLCAKVPELVQAALERAETEHAVVVAAMTWSRMPQERAKRAALFQQCRALARLKE